jgi:hypothetical protein
MIGRVHPNDAMRLVLRRLRAHGRDVRQDDRGAPTWVATCPAHEGNTGPGVRIDQHNDGTVVVHPHTAKGCTPETILAALSIDDTRIVPFGAANGHPFRPARPRTTGPTESSHAIFDRLTEALAPYAGRRSPPRYDCPACGAKGDGHGLRVDHDPNRPRKILLLCDSNRCPPDEILEPLGMTLAELCVGDDTDDLGEEDSAASASEGGENGRRRPGPPDAEADLANARRLVEMFGDRLRYVVSWKKWLCWDGTRWAVDDTGGASRYAKKIADMLPKTTKGGGPARAQTAPGIAAMLTLAGTEPGVALSPADLDTDPYLLNVANGTLDLRTGRLRPHSPDGGELAGVDPAAFGEEQPEHVGLAAERAGGRGYLLGFGEAAVLPLPVASDDPRQDAVRLQRESFG